MPVRIGSNGPIKKQNIRKSRLEPDWSVVLFWANQLPIWIWFSELHVFDWFVCTRLESLLDFLNFDFVEIFGRFFVISIGLVYSWEIMRLTTLYSNSVVRTRVLEVARGIQQQRGSSCWRRKSRANRKDKPYGTRGWDTGKHTLIAKLSQNLDWGGGVYS